MATFKALNLESDSESDVEIDDTKEIQIEEALKLYQTALKLHSDGPAHYKEATEAYNALFESDIFKYAESQSELRRIDLYGPLPEKEETWLEEQEDILFEPVPVGENAPSTLPQILHLSHKNYGDFLLDYLQAELRSNPEAASDHTLQQITLAASSALDHFVEALDKDDSDLDLWRRASSLGELLDSRRIARFCLESVLDDDDEALASTLALPGLAESAASQQLSELVATFDDTLSLLQSPLSTKKRRHVSKMLKDRLDVYASAKKIHTQIQGDQRIQEKLDSKSPQRNVLAPPTTWSDFADLLLDQLHDQQNGSSSSLNANPGSALEFDLDRMATNGMTSHEMEQLQTMEDADSVTVLPTTLEAQFPGLDGGEPTAPVPAFGDVMKLRRGSTGTEITSALPTRKRSGDAAGLLDHAESGRLKSKRLRARESLVDGSSLVDSAASKAAQQLEAQLEELRAIDEWCFESFNRVLKRSEVATFEISPTLRKTLSTPAASEQTGGTQLAQTDLYGFLGNFQEPVSRLLTRPDASTSLDAPQTGLLTALPGSTSSISKSFAKPPLDAKSGLTEFLAEINQDWLRPSDVAFLWIQMLLKPGCPSVDPKLLPSETSYVAHKWPEAVKRVVARVLVDLDYHVYTSMQDKIGRPLDDPDTYRTSNEDLLGDIEMIETIYELHLDILSLIKMPNSGCDAQTIVTQESKADRWAELARDALRLRLTILEQEDLIDELNLRYLWSTTFHISTRDTISQDYVIVSLQELRSLFVAVKSPVIDLQNNAVMPVMSVEAIDRELSKLTTSDFFSKMFESNDEDPVSVIEGLEPILEYLHQDVSADLVPSTEHDSKSPERSESKRMDVDDPAESPSPATQFSPELVDFLKNSKSSVRLALWQRLRLAYQAIDYLPMVAHCYFRAIEILVLDIQSTSYAELTAPERQTLLLSTLRQVQEMMNRFYEMTKIREDVLDVLDEQRAHVLATSLVKLLSILHSAVLVEDEIRLGQRQTPGSESASTARGYEKFVTVIHNLQLNLWVLLYLVLKESAAQPLESSFETDEEKMEMLRSLHRAIGVRGFCDGSNRVLLNLIKKEIIGLKHVEGFDLEYSQILFDIYGLRCFVNPSYEQLDHQCQRDAFLDRSAALQAVDFLLNQAAKIKILDLTKHPIKDAIEKVHGVVARKKPSDAILRNKEIYRAFFRSPIRPLDMYGCLSGQGNLNMVAVPGTQSSLADKGWYFLMGNVALTKYRSQKRVAPGPTEDLDIAIAFFMQDLEYGSEKWETWFRLAQAYDSKIEDMVAWSADKLNNSMSEVAQCQRSAIHAYIIATGQATRIEEAGFETSAKVAELYADFATRIYSSSRAPFDMLAFSLEDAERFLSQKTLIKVKPFKPLTEYQAWKFAKALYHRAIAGNPEKWTLHYMLSKCLWKMHSAEAANGGSPTTSYRAVISALSRAIELVPKERKDSKKEAILEPHYRLASVVHKMVCRKTIEPAEACQVLDATPYARKVEKVSEFDEWESYILSLLKNLRTADKSNWHHRMIARAARIIYGDGTEFTSAIGAKHELTQQMFTKAMGVQVWKPENERPGRHFVYTTRYSQFFNKILDQLNDRAGIEALAKKVRRRPVDYYKHNDLWLEICNSYLKLLRKYGQVPIGHETAIFSGIDHQEFSKRKEPLETWCQDPESKNPTLDTLRDVIEFKKINSNLMKPGLIDDLIGDAYAYLFDTVGRKLWNAQDANGHTDADGGKGPELFKSSDLSHMINLDGAVSSTPAASDNGPKMDTGSADQAPVKRKMGVGRREIRLCADACVEKRSAPGPEQNSRRTTPPDRVQIIIPSRRRTDGTLESSIHDDADDESELSEIDDGAISSLPSSPGEDILMRPMFPGLARRVEEDGETGEGDDEDEDEQEEEAEEHDEHGDVVMQEGEGMDEEEDEEVEEEEGEEQEEHEDEGAEEETNVTGDVLSQE
ncbi:hypothetical protein MBLNU457_6110t1 [Dothideomycetes sp. NU457]